ncbi:MAG TPA: hydrogenase maturation protease [Candidatus Omnitrophota bacterium]|nr:hydrogenase maturation protease [Candidatus Omnitrophota bacterium]
MKTLLIGIGHQYRGDDAVGPLVAGRIAAMNLPDLDVLAHHGEGTDLMERWAGYDRVVVVDATCGGGEIGTIRRWDAVAAPLPAGLFPKGSHVFGLAEGVEMARLLGRLPAAMTVIGIEGELFSAGDVMSPQVEQASETVAGELISSS